VTGDSMTDAQLLARIRAHYAAALDLGLPDLRSTYWQDLLARGRQGFGGKGDYLDRDDLWASLRNNIITKGLDNSNVPDDALPRLHEKCRRAYVRLAARIPERYRPYLADSDVGAPRALEVDGIRITQSSLEYTCMIARLDQYLEGVDALVEIGGGYGGLARLVKLARPACRIVILDLPEINAIQTYYLARCFPSARILGLADVVDRDEVDPAALGADFLLLPGQLIDRLAPSSFGAAVNTRSMMEMDLETVSFYLSHVQRRIRTGGVFYCVNRYEKKTRLRDYPFDDRWYVTVSEPWPTVIDENPHHELAAIRAAFPVRFGLREHLAGDPVFRRGVAGGAARLKRAWMGDGA
jgi:putative sugar O-methyltransferase